MLHRIFVIIIGVVTLIVFTFGLHPFQGFRLAEAADDIYNITTIDTGNVGGSTSSAADGDYKAHVACLHQTDGDLKHATNASGSWITTTILNTGSGGGPTVVDTDNYVYVSTGAQYITNTSGSWVTTTILNTGSGGPTAVDTDNHVQYQRRSPISNEHIWIMVNSNYR